MRGIEIPAVAPGTGASRRQILDHAANLFRNEGYAAVGLRDIAAASGLKAASLYHHFASKDEIVIEILNIGVRRVHDAVAAAVPPHAPMADAIGAAVHAHLRAIHEAGDYTSANIRIFGQVPKTVRDGHQPVRRAYQRLWDDLLARGVAQGALRGDLHLPRLRNFVLGAMNASLEWVEPRRGTVAPIAAELTRLVLHGAAATAA